MLRKKGKKTFMNGRSLSTTILIYVMGKETFLSLDALDLFTFPSILTYKLSLVIIMVGSMLIPIMDMFFKSSASKRPDPQKLRKKGSSKQHRNAYNNQEQNQRQQREKDEQEQPAKKYSRTVYTKKLLAKMSVKELKTLLWVKR